MDDFSLEQTLYFSWLTDRALNEIVGKCRSATGCPLALFIRRHTGHPFWQVSWSESGCFATRNNNGVRTTYQLPAWCHAFVRAIDEILPLRASTPYERVHVTAQNAIWMLTGWRPLLDENSRTDDNLITGDGNFESKNSERDGEPGLS